MSDRLIQRSYLPELSFSLAEWNFNLIEAVANIVWISNIAKIKYLYISIFYSARQPFLQIF